ncbi:MAG: hypothetical protein J6A46_05800 [Clostridia bacterium]|nr:hypothetical protein [Clostridia bacterium]
MNISTCFCPWDSEIPVGFSTHGRERVSPPKWAFSQSPAGRTGQYPCDCHRS